MIASFFMKLYKVREKKEYFSSMKKNDIILPKEMML